MFSLKSFLKSNTPVLASSAKEIKRESDRKSKTGSPLRKAETKRRNSSRLILKRSKKRMNESNNLKISRSNPVRLSLNRKQRLRISSHRYLNINKIPLSKIKLPNPMNLLIL